MTREEKRLILHRKLVEILGTTDKPRKEQRVYFQPTINTEMKFPCIVYTQGAPEKVNADNKAYFINTPYTVIYIDRSPVSDIPDKLLDMEYTMAERPYQKDNMHYFPFRTFT